MGPFRALAIDYDGTLTRGGPPGPALLAALADVRGQGLVVVLVTGRILDELRGVFPDVEQHFDLIVAENGAVLVHDGHQHALADPVPVALDAALVEQRVPFRRGQVILATAGAYDALLLAELRRHGLDCQLARNRGELMVLPAAVSKGSGLGRGLAHLGISPHSALAVGDAENDLSLLETCELGVAVADAVESLRTHADVVLSGANGEGVLALLGGPLLRGQLRVEPRRWQVELGATPEGRRVRVPASQVDLLVAGGSGSGKSFAAGLIAEQLVELGYSLCVLDPEGDHAPLGRLPGVVTLGGSSPPPDPEDVVRILAQSMTSVVVDLSQRSTPERAGYLAGAIPVLERARASRGIPHWLVVDEAHGAFGAHGVHLDPWIKGHCLVTYRPEALPEEVVRRMDFLLLLAGDAGIEPAALTAFFPELSLEAAGSCGKERRMGEGVLVRLGARPELQSLTLGARWLEHVRHWHKYLHAQLPPERRFFFRDRAGRHGAAAGNLVEFHRALARASEGELAHHARGGDFSRWLAEVIADEPLAAAFQAVEQRLEGSPGGGADVEAARLDWLSAIESRYAP